jgi:hypothetical protein
VGCITHEGVSLFKASFAQIKQDPQLRVFFYRYFSGCGGSCDGIKRTNSDIVIPVAFNTLAMLYVDGQRGCPYLLKRLLLLNVVASNPENLASPEHDILRDAANLTIARHKSSCVMVLTLLFLITRNTKTILIMIENSS